MNVIQFDNGSVDVTINTVEGSLKTGGGHDDLYERFNAGETPIVRNGVARNGSCLVEVGDGSDNTATLAELQTLHSGTGAGDYVITIDGEVYSYLAIVDIYIVGDGLQLMRVEWKGTIESVDL